MPDVLITTDHLDAVSSEECHVWMVDNVRGSAIGHMKEGEFYIAFSDEKDAGAFTERWLSG